MVGDLDEASSSLKAAEEAESPHDSNELADDENEDELSEVEGSEASEEGPDGAVKKKKKKKKVGSRIFCGVLFDAKISCDFILNAPLILFPFPLFIYLLSRRRRSQVERTLANPTPVLTLQPAKLQTSVSMNAFHLSQPTATTPFGYVSTTPT